MSKSKTIKLKTTQKKQSTNELLKESFKSPNLFVNRENPSRYEDQRNSYLETSLKISHQAFAKIFGDDNANKIIQHYLSEERYGNKGRFYHVTSHPLVQILGVRAAKFLKDAQDKKWDDNEISQELDNNPEISEEFRRCFEHDLVQSYDRSWKNFIATITKKSVYMNGTQDDGSIKTIEDLVNAVSNDESKSQNLKEKFQLTAKLFFPNNKQSITNPNGIPVKGLVEFLSVLDAEYKKDELLGDNKRDFADFLGTAIFILGTIPFCDNCVFSEMPKKVFEALSAEQKKILLDKIKDKGITFGEYKKLPEDPDFNEGDNDKLIYYWISQEVSKACSSANLDVINFAHEDYFCLYYGDRSIGSEFAKNYLTNLKAPEDQAEEIAKFINAHKSPKGFLISNATNGLIYHQFKSSFCELSVLSEAEKEILHNDYIKNSEIVSIMHKMDYIEIVSKIVMQDVQIDFSYIENADQINILFEYCQEFLSAKQAGEVIKNGIKEQIEEIKILPKNQRTDSTPDLRTAGVRFHKKAEELALRPQKKIYKNSLRKSGSKKDEESVKKSQPDTSVKYITSLIKKVKSIGDTKSNS